ncbi:MAG: hypothetical protein NDJ75_06735 [Thermoanaerobaculia bacterium]|nr:hypothetical protein [Thermoanaerobaculia bacterium]
MSVLLLATLLAAPAPAAVDLRSLELLREECSSRISRREIVFFANGTVRLREGVPGELRTTLGELGRPEADAVRRRLAEIVVDSVEVLSVAPDGDWVETCRLTLLVAGGGERQFAYGRLDAGSLELEKLRRIVEELGTAARDDGGSIDIPANYRARLGDRLERADGAVFEVVGWTSDGKAVELVSDAPPLTLFVEATQLRAEFRRLLSRRGEP